MKPICPHALSRLLRLLVAGSVLAALPVGFQFEPSGTGIWSLGAPMALASGGDDDEEEDDDSGRGRNRGRGGDDDDDDDDSSGPGGGGGDDDDDNSGPGGGDDDNDRPDSPPPSSVSSNPGGQSWVVAWYRVAGRDIEVHYTDGWWEVISSGTYALFDSRNRTVIRRAAGTADYDRLAPLFRTP